LGVGRLGLWEGGFEWNQIPHTSSTNARFMAAENPFGVFTLSTPRPPAHQRSAPAATPFGASPPPTPPPPLNQHNAAGEPDEIALRRDTARFSFKLTPTPWIDLTAEYTKIRNHGERPFGMAFGSPGNNFYEILEPLEQTTHDFRVKAVL